MLLLFLNANARDISYVLSRASLGLFRSFLVSPSASLLYITSIAKSIREMQFIFMFVFDNYIVHLAVHLCISLAFATPSPPHCLAALL